MIAGQPQLEPESSEERYDAWENLWERSHPEQRQENAEPFAHEERGRQRAVEEFDPEDFAEIDVRKFVDAVRIPRHERAEEVPVGPAQEGSEDDEYDPENDETEHPGENCKFAFL